MNTLRAVSPILPYVVRTPADLRMLLRPQAILRPIRKPGVLVRIPQLSPSECLVWQERLDPLTQECGCNTGTIAVGLFLVLAVAAALLFDSPNEVRFPLATYLIGAACFLAGLILSAIVGKLFGQALAALRLHRACRELESELSLRPSPSH